MFTCINAKDNITNVYETLSEALGMATRCYDGAGIICTILDGDGNQVSYHFTPSRKAVTFQ